MVWAIAIERVQALDAEGSIVAFEITLDAIPAPKASADQDQAEAYPLDFSAPVERTCLRRRETVSASDIPAAESAERRSSPGSACSTFIAAKAWPRARSRSPFT
jgi:hypothetical protein